MPAGQFFILILLAVALLFVFAWIVQVTFNNSIAVMGRTVQVITYWQAFAFLMFLLITWATLFMLASLLVVPLALAMAPSRALAGAAGM